MFHHSLIGLGNQHFAAPISQQPKRTIMKLTPLVTCVFIAIASASAQQLIYDNTLNFSGQVYLNGGAANQAGNTITRLVADDITPLSGYAGMPIQTISFSVGNLNPVAVSAR